MSKRPVLRVRMSGAVLVAALIALVGAVPLAGSSWALSPLFLIPIAVLAWAWRAGTDVYPGSCGSAPSSVIARCRSTASPSSRRTSGAGCRRCSTTAPSSGFPE
ncbi:hypothetical protein [Actinoplanes sp. CA-252034]|uniref:hypothetical protein n=1 Tax=Actinoplanes sp. CA-252034 TaxID=3239906 RepID=UPI003D97AF72